jgi:hypothetical protein
MFITRIGPRSLGYQVRNEDCLPVTPSLGVPEGELHSVDVLWSELQPFSDAHPIFRHELQEEPVPANLCGVDHLVHCFSVDHRSGPDTRGSV